MDKDKINTNQNIEDGLPLRLRTYDYEGIAKRLKNMERHDDIIKQLRRKIIEEPLDSRTLPPAATIHFQRILDAYDKLNKTAAVKKFKDDEIFKKIAENIHNELPNLIFHDNILEEIKNNELIQKYLKKSIEKSLNMTIEDFIIGTIITMDKAIDKGLNSDSVVSEILKEILKKIKDKNIRKEMEKRIIKVFSDAYKIFAKERGQERAKIKKEKKYFQIPKNIKDDNNKEHYYVTKNLPGQFAPEKTKLSDDKEILSINNLTIESLVKLANVLDSEGFYELSDVLDNTMNKIAKSKYKTLKGKDEKPPKGAAHKAPKEWWKKPEEKEKSKVQAADEGEMEKEMFFLTAKICLLDNLEERRGAVKELQELGATNSQIKEMKEWFEREIIPDLKSKEEAIKELRERFGKKTVLNNLTIESLVKLANLLDEEGFYSIASMIDETTKKIIDIRPTSQVEVIADRCVDEIGRLLKEKKDIEPKIRKRLINIILSLESLKADFAPQNLVEIANFLDDIGLVKIANSVDDIIVLAKKELKPPKKWWAKMKEELKEKNPNFNYKKIGEIIRNIWNTQIDEKKKREICKEYKK